MYLFTICFFPYVFYFYILFFKKRPQAIYVYFSLFFKMLSFREQKVLCRVFLSSCLVCNTSTKITIFVAAYCCCKSSPVRRCCCKSDPMCGCCCKLSFSFTFALQVLLFTFRSKTTKQVPLLGIGRVCFFPCGKCAKNSFKL